MTTTETQTRPTLWSSLRNINLRAYGMVIALVAIMLLFQVLVVMELDQNFITSRNITNVIVQNAPILILAIGMMLVIINGHIDLSVGSVLAFTGAVAAIAISDWGMPWWAGVLAAIGAGAIIGAWQGFWVAYMRIPAFIVTLAGMLIFRGLTLQILGAETITIGAEEFLKLGGGAAGYQAFGVSLQVPTLIFGILAAALIVAVETTGRRRRTAAGIESTSNLMWSVKIVALVVVIVGGSLVFFSYRGLPIVGWILLGLVLLYTFITNRTVFGRHIYAGGGNEKAALLSGVKTKQTTFWVFVNMGALAGLAGVVATARLNSATTTAGDMFELSAIASSFIGGASMSGGVGTIIGAIIGGLVMGVMDQGMSSLGVATQTVQVVLGLVVLAAVVFDVWNKKRATGGGLMPPIVGTTPGGSGDAKRKAEEGTDKEPTKAGTLSATTDDKTIS
ncbi:multiple monosaccharide ABC transporter permease [Glycomyces sp. NPDC021274]|uniref:multiple monosaccharide ABC transporter permease n=1 Tax=Glycomyces sp. NPDC021274 TaxID=3155120 RepID=UPI0033CF548E